MIILVTGDRNWVHKDIIRQAFLAKVPQGKHTLIHGAARGADTLSGLVADSLGWSVTEVPAEWRKYGRAAGRVRNIKMLDMKPDVVLAFHNNLTESKGTKHCVANALKRGIPVYLWSADGYMMRPVFADVT